MARLVPSPLPCRRNDEVTASLSLLHKYAALDVAGCDQRAFRLVGVDIDKADMHAREGFAALHIDNVMNGTRAVGQVASVPAGNGTGDLDVLDRVIIAIAERECDQ